MDIFDILVYFLELIVSTLIHPADFGLIDKKLILLEG